MWSLQAWGWFFFFLIFTEFVSVLLLFVSVLLLFMFFFFFFGFWLWGMWDLSFQTRDGTCTSCIGRRSLNHWTTREIPWWWSFSRLFKLYLKYAFSKLFVFFCFLVCVPSFCKICTYLKIIEIFLSSNYIVKHIF